MWESRIDSDESMVPTAESTRLTDTSAKVSAAPCHHAASRSAHHERRRPIANTRSSPGNCRRGLRERRLTRSRCERALRGWRRADRHCEGSRHWFRVVSTDLSFSDPGGRIHSRPVGGAGVSARGPELRGRVPVSSRDQCTVVLHRRQAGRRTRSAPLLQQPSRKPWQPSARVTAPAGPLRQSSRHRPVASPRRQPWPRDVAPSSRLPTGPSGCGFRPSPRRPPSSAPSRSGSDAPRSRSRGTCWLSASAGSCWTEASRARPNVFRLRLGMTALRLVMALVGLSLFALGPSETALQHSILVPAPFRIGLQPIAIALRSSVFTFARSLALLGPNMHATETMTGGVASGARDRRIGVLGPEQPAHAPATGRRSTDTAERGGGVEMVHWS